MILVIDNYDSFTHNLARHMALTGWEYTVVRNDRISINEIRTMAPEAIILSPGPCTPAEAGICIDTVKHLGPTIPILGVCLGHQCIGEAYGAQTCRTTHPTHGKGTLISHTGQDIFKGLPSPMTVGRYHSLIVEPPRHSDILITASGPYCEVMALRHRIYPVFGVQFHPESILTKHGLALLGNFKTIAQRWNTTVRRTKQQAA